MEYPTHILDILEKHDKPFYEADDLFDPYEEQIKMSRTDFSFLFNTLVRKGLISEKDGNYVFSELGKTVLAEQKQKEAKEEAKTNLESDKLRFETKIAKRKLKTYYPLLIIALLSGVYSGYDFITGLNKTPNSELVPKLEFEKRINELENKLHILDSTLTKVNRNQDSLTSE